MLMSLPDASDSDQQIVDWMADSGNRTQVLIGAYVLAVAGVAMLFFMNRLRAVVADAEGDRPLVAPFILAAGAIFVVAMAVGGAAIAAVPVEIQIGEAPTLSDPDLVRFLPSLGYGVLLVLGMFPLIFAMLATAYASMRYKIFATWFNWLTIVCAIALFFAAVFIPVIALLIWTIAGSFVLLGRQPVTVARTQMATA
jgi:hypothetical protein